MGRFRLSANGLGRCGSAHERLAERRLSDCGFRWPEFQPKFLQLTGRPLRGEFGLGVFAEPRGSGSTSQRRHSPDGWQSGRPTSWADDHAVVTSRCGSASSYATTTNSAISRCAKWAATWSFPCSDVAADDSCGNIQCVVTGMAARSGGLAACFHGAGVGGLVCADCATASAPVRAATHATVGLSYETILNEVYT